MSEYRSVDQAEFNWHLQRCQEMLATIPDAIEEKVLRNLEWRESPVYEPDQPQRWPRWQLRHPTKGYDGRIIGVEYRTAAGLIGWVSNPLTRGASYTLDMAVCRGIIYGDPWQ